EALDLDRSQLGQDMDANRVLVLPPRRLPDPVGGDIGQPGGHQIPDCDVRRPDRDAAI
ncbi:MAG: hypothetical protein AVDCRST_MAG33-802, partial [uncultured Thermomicrobiales bacterium]